jgi:hypothetical protein
MRYVALGFVFMLGCQQSTRTTAAPSTLRARTLFTDSAIYRARCKEADTAASLQNIPPKCTPRDQRLDVR